MNDELANDRTFLAWLRTGIALIGLGFIVAKVALIVIPTQKVDRHPELYAAAGIVMVLCGAALVVVGFFQHRTILNVLRTGDAKPGPRWPLTITVTAVVASVLLSVLIAIST